MKKDFNKYLKVIKKKLSREKETPVETIKDNLKQYISLRKPTSDSALKVIADAVKARNKELGFDKLRTSPEELTEEGIQITETTEERVEVSQVWLSRAETMYRLDPLIFAGVNKLNRLISSPRILITGTSKDNKAIIEGIMETLKLRKIIKKAVKDILIYGFSFIEIVKDSNKNILRLALVDPKEIDYERDQNSMDIKLNPKTKEIVGYTWKKYQSQDKKNIPKENGILLNFFTVGECLGISPLEPIFKVSWIRLNLEDSLGEAIYRHGYPLYYFRIGNEKKPANPQMIKDAKEILKDWQSASEIILPDWVTVDSVESKAPIGQLAELLLFFASQQAAGMEIPRAFLLGGERGGRGTLEPQNLDFEKAIACFQEDLLDELQEQLWDQIKVYVGMDPKPRFVFEESSPEHKLFRIRRLSMLSQRNLLTRDDQLESQIRIEENLPPLSNEEDNSCVFLSVEECPVLLSRKVSMKDLANFCEVCPLKSEPKVKPKIKNIPEEEAKPEELKK